MPRAYRINDLGPLDYVVSRCKITRPVPGSQQEHPTSAGKSQFWRYFNSIFEPPNPRGGELDNRRPLGTNRLNLRVQLPASVGLLSFSLIFWNCHFVTGIWVGGIFL